MQDAEAIEAFVRGRARKGFGMSLHIEGDALMLDGWWHVSVRIRPDTFILRNEETPRDTSVLKDMADALSAEGYCQVDIDHPLIQPITYVTLSVGALSWALWAPDLATGEAALAERSGAESFFGEEPAGGVDLDKDFTAELGGARRIGGLPPSLVLTVGVERAKANKLRAALPEVRLEAKDLGDIDPDTCGSLIPAIVLVDASTPAGREFVMELRVSACGRYVPVVALTPAGDLPLGADVVLDPALEAAEWVEPLRRLLP
ncbi:MAG: hypothetical protein ACRD0D_06255 [Acidimicrobiales bacterium]